MGLLKTPFNLALDLKAEVAESPLWDAKRGVVWLADVEANRVLAYDVQTKQVKTFTFPEVVPSIGLCRSGCLLVAQRRSVLLFDPATGAQEVLTELTGELPQNRLNDSKTGPDGCYWVGSMNDLPDKTPSAILWRITPDGKAERKLDGLTLINGIAWSPGAERMYVTDTRGPWIDVWDFDVATGGMSNRRRVATLAQEDGRPDGGACDAAGRYWSAGVSAGCLNVFSPTGALEEKIAFPVPSPTMPCFAGQDLTSLFVTSLKHGRPEEMQQRYPAMGGVFFAPGAPAGLALTPFADGA
jgi:sugar lactone lactonase YvrE